MDATPQELLFLVRVGALKLTSPRAVLLSLKAACNIMEGFGCSAAEVWQSFLQYKHNHPSLMQFGAHMTKLGHHEVWAVGAMPWADTSACSPSHTMPDLAPFGFHTAELAQFL